MNHIHTSISLAIQYDIGASQGSLSHVQGYVEHMCLRH